MYRFFITLSILCVFLAVGQLTHAQTCVANDVYRAVSLAKEGKLDEVTEIVKRCSSEPNVLLSYGFVGVMHAKTLNADPQRQAAILKNVWWALDRSDLAKSPPQDTEARISVRKDAAALLVEMSDRNDYIDPMFEDGTALPVCPFAASSALLTLFYNYRKAPGKYAPIYAKKIIEACPEETGIALNPHYYYVLLLAHQASLETDKASAAKLMGEARERLNDVVGTRVLNGSYELDVHEFLREQAKLEIAAGVTDPLNILQGDLSGALTPVYLEALIGYQVNEIWGPHYSVGKTEESKEQFKAQLKAYTIYISELERVAKAKGMDARWIVYRGLAGHARGTYRTNERRDYKVFLDSLWERTRPEP